MGLAQHLMATAIVFGAMTLAPAALAGGENGSEVSFTEDIVPVLKRRCAVCHLTGQEPGGMSLVPAKAYDNLVGVASQQGELLRVKPGDPQGSYLYRKLMGTHTEAGGNGARMPFGAPPLPEDHLELIRLWIEQGAPEN